MQESRHIKMSSKKANFSNYMHFAHTVGYTYECSWMFSVFQLKGYRGNILGIASPLVHRGAGRPSAGLPWPMCLQRPRSAADALALACLSPSSGLWTYFCRWCRRVGWLGRTERQSPALGLLRNAAGPTTRSHTASNTINQVSGISLISYWGEQPEKLHTQSWPRKVGRGPALCGHQASLSRFLYFAVSNVSFIFIHNHFACQVYKWMRSSF